MESIAWCRDGIYSWEWKVPSVGCLCDDMLGSGSCSWPLHCILSPNFQADAVVGPNTAIHGAFLPPGAIEVGWNFRQQDPGGERKEPLLGSVPGGGHHVATFHVCPDRALSATLRSGHYFHFTHKENKAQTDTQFVRSTIKIFNPDFMLPQWFFFFICDCNDLILFFVSDLCWITNTSNSQCPKQHSLLFKKICSSPAPSLPREKS